MEFHTEKFASAYDYLPLTWNLRVPKLVMFKYIHFMAQLLLNAGKTKDDTWLNHIELR